MSASLPAAANPALHDPDVRLMLQVRDDSAAAFEELVLRYQRRLVTILEHLTGRRDEAEDLAQEVFLRVYRARKNYVPGAKFSTWLFTIANNLASNAQRNRSRRREVQLAAAGGGSSAVYTLEGMAQAASGQMPTRQLDRLEMSEVVRAAMEGLGERQRMALLLSKFEGMNYAEIAEAMETTEKAVKSLLTRARAALRELLEPYLNEGQRPAPPATVVDKNDPADKNDPITEEA